MVELFFAKAQPEAPSVAETVPAESPAVVL